MTGLYFIAVLAVALVAVFRGFRAGFIGCVADVLGLGFGITCARMFGEPFEIWLRGVFTSWAGRVTGEFVYSLAAATLIFVVTFVVFRFIGQVLKAAMSVIHVGTFNSLAGCLFCLMEYLLFLSLAFNVFVAVRPRSSLMKTATADDGNIVRETMFLGPALLGCENFEELAHKLQLEDARKISENRRPGGKIPAGENDIAQRC